MWVIVDAITRASGKDLPVHLYFLSTEVNGFYLCPFYGDLNVIGTSSNSHKKIKALVFGLELRLKIKWLLVNEVVCFLFSLHQGLSTVCTTFLLRHPPKSIASQIKVKQTRSATFLPKIETRGLFRPPAVEGK